MSEVICNIFVDTRIELYEGFLPDDWVSNVFEAAKPAPVLVPLLNNLLVSWRGGAYTAAMPAIMTKGITKSTAAYASVASPDSSLISFGDAVLMKVSRRIPELAENSRLSARILEELVKVTAEFRDARVAALTAIADHTPVQEVWDDSMKDDVFGLCVWSGQRVAYVAFYNAYESFLVGCVRQLLKNDALRTTDKEFKDGLKRGFAKNIYDQCWMEKDVNIGRLVRHALSHNEGRESNELKRLPRRTNKPPHDIELVGEVLQITPNDNHSLLKCLRKGVDAIVAVAALHPRFAT